MSADNRYSSYTSLDKLLEVRETLEAELRDAQTAEVAARNRQTQVRNEITAIGLRIQALLPPALRSPNAPVIMRASRVEDGE